MFFSSNKKVFALFFAVLIGAWSPMNNKGVIDEQSPNNNSPVGFPNFLLSTQKQIIENPEKLQTKPIDDSFKSRVLLSIDEQEHQNQQAPNSSPIDFSRTLETFRNKRRRTEDPRFPPKNFIVIEEGVPTFDSMTNRTQKIIRVERTRPSAFNDTLKLAKQFSDHWTFFLEIEQLVKTIPNQFYFSKNLLFLSFNCLISMEFHFVQEKERRLAELFSMKRYVTMNVFFY